MSPGEVEPLPLWAQLALVFTVPLWVPLAPAAGWWQARRDR